MATSDYYLCDVCGGKCFYDANLNYNYSQSDGDVLISGTEYSLDYCGDMAAICTSCAETHEVVVSRKGERNGRG